MRTGTPQRGVATVFLPLLSARAYGVTTKQPDIKLNPSPRMRYEITATSSSGRRLLRPCVCHWSVVGASVDFHHGEVNFSPAIYHDDIVSQKSVTRYFSERSYERSSRPRIDIGSPRKADFIDPGAVFSITLKSTEQSQ